VLVLVLEMEKHLRRYSPPNVKAKNSARSRYRFVMRVIRAGFEPRRGRATSQGLDGPQNDHTLGLATRTHGSNPPRSGQRGGIHFLAPRFSPYQTLGGEHRRAFPRFEHEHEHEDD